MRRLPRLHGLLVAFIVLNCTVVTSAQRRPQTSPPETKPVAARLMVQGTYEETYQGATSDGSAEGKLVIKFEAARWLKMGTNEVGNAEFSDLENAPVPSVSGSASYNGRVKGSTSGESYEATSSFAGPLGGNDIVLSVPGYSDTRNDFKLRVFINPKLKGKCSLVAVRNGETATANACQNGTYFFTASTPLQIDDNDDPAKTADTANLANFGIELDIEPALEAAGNPVTGSAGQAGDAGDYAWRGAVTNGSKEAGFKIMLTKTKELPTSDKRGKSVRTLSFTATIVPGTPEGRNGGRQ
jgi:hypothetical protein